MKGGLVGSFLIIRKYRFSLDKHIRITRVTKSYPAKNSELQRIDDNLQLKLNLNMYMTIPILKIKFSHLNMVFDWLI